MYVRRRVSGNNGREVCFLQFRQKTRAARVTSSRRETRARPSPSHRHMRCEARHERVYSLLVLLLSGPRRRCPYAYGMGENDMYTLQLEFIIALHLVTNGVISYPM